MPSDKIRQLEIELNEVLVMTLNELIAINDKLKAGEITYEEWLELAFPSEFYDPEPFDEETDPALADYRQLKEQHSSHAV